MGEIPAFYDFINAHDSYIQPGTVHSQNTGMVRYFKRYLLEKAISVFKWTMPDHWIKPYALYSLYSCGFFAVINTDQYGVIPQNCTLSGRGVQYEPTHVLISNPLLAGLKMPRIGEECALIQLRPDYGGILDLVNDYAEQMALTSELLSINTLNSRLSYVFGASSKRAAESFKKAMDELYMGNPMTVIDKDLMTNDGQPAWQLLLPNVGQNYVAGEILENLRKLECKFNNEIGIPANLATDKKERIISAEVEANDAETYGRAADWLELLQMGCKQASDMFGIELSVDWRINPMKANRKEVSGNAPDDQSADNGE